jgi:hypothetical protein
VVRFGARVVRCGLLIRHPPHKIRAAAAREPARPQDGVMPPPHHPPAEVDTRSHWRGRRRFRPVIKRLAFGTAPRQPCRSRHQAPVCPFARLPGSEFSSPRYYGSDHSIEFRQQEIVACRERPLVEPSLFCSNARPPDATRKSREYRSCLARATKLLSPGFQHISSLRCDRSLSVNFHPPGLVKISQRQ